MINHDSAAGVHQKQKQKQKTFQEYIIQYSVIHFFIMFNVLFQFLAIMHYNRINDFVKIQYLDLLKSRTRVECSGIFLISSQSLSEIK